MYGKCLAEIWKQFYNITTRVRAGSIVSSFFFL